MTLEFEKLTINEVVLLHSYASQRLNDVEKRIEDSVSDNPNDKYLIEESNHWFKIEQLCDQELEIRTGMYKREDAETI